MISLTYQHKIYKKESEDYLSISPAAVADRHDFVFLMHQYVSGFYPETETAYGRNFFNAYLSKSQLHNPSSKRRFVYKLTLNNETIGFITSTIKDGYSVKIGQCVLKPEFWNKGYITYFLKFLIGFYQKQNFFKIYATAPANHPGACGCLLASGFEFETVMKKHFHNESNEIVFSKILNININSATTISENLLHCKSHGEHDLFDYAINPCKLFLYKNDAAALTYPKRGGAVRLALQNPNINTLEPLINDAVNFYVKAGKRRIYTLIPELAVKNRALFLKNSFEEEGKIMIAGMGNNLILTAINF